MNINDKTETRIEISDLERGEIFFLNDRYYLKLTDLNDVLCDEEGNEINCYNFSQDCLAMLNVHTEINKRCDNVTLNID